MVKTSLLQKIARFGLTGLIATGLHIFIAYAWMQQPDASSPIANVVAYVVSTIFSFFSLTIWSFSHQVQVRSTVKFLIVNVIGLCLSYGIAKRLADLGYPYSYGIAAIVCVMPPLNFLLHHFWTYRRT